MLQNNPVGLTAIAFPIATSSISVGQQDLQLIGQNLANANTPGYHRQADNLESSVTGGTTGTGVDVATITRYAAPAVESAIYQGNADQSYASTRLDTQNQLEASLGTGANGIDGGLQSFFNQVNTLSATPDSVAVRQTLLGTASQLTGQFNTAANSIDKLRNNVGGQVSQTVTQINSLTQQIATLNVQIAQITGGGQSANDLIDHRGQLITQLSQLASVRTVPQPLNQVNVLGENTFFVVGQSANTFSVAPNAAGNLNVTQAGLAQPVAFTTGTLGAQLQDFNVDIPADKAKLDTVANTLNAQVNEIQATGLGLSGPISSTTGSVSVLDPTQPLATQNLPFPIQAGNLTLSITNNASGNRTNTTIAIDPATQSLNAVAAAITAAGGGNVTASVVAGSNTLKISAAAGFSFDFAGRDTIPPSGGAVANPDTANILSGLGVNGFFTGSGANGIAVNPALTANPQLLAAGQSGLPADTSNLDKITALANQSLIAGSTIATAFTTLGSSVGTTIQNLNDQQASQQGLLLNLNAQSQSVSGVDTNQELTSLLNAQRQVQSASQYLSVVNTALDALMSIIK